jgi:tripartite-type tricarboxylate transporter receptor subunit TctC
VLRARVWATLFIACVALSAPASADDYPNRPVKIVVPYAAGGGTDALTRFVAHGLEQRLGQPVIVENRSGAGTTVGGLAVARADPDGYTLMMGTSSTFAIAPGLYKRLAYDPVKDFTPIMLVATVPFVMVVHPSLGVNSLSELVALAKKKPGELLFASAGVGSVHHVYAEVLMRMMGFEMKHVPYRGGGQGLNDVVAGHVPVYIGDAGPIQPLIRSGKLKALGVTTGQRVATMPEVPTLNEAGAKGFDANSWQMFAAPAHLPAPILFRLNGAIGAFMRTPEAQQHFTSLGMEPNTGTPEQAQAYIRTEAERWTAILKDMGISVE